MLNKQETQNTLGISYNLCTETPVLICENVSCIGRASYFIPVLSKQMFMTMLFNLIGRLARKRNFTTSNSGTFAGLSRSTHQREGGLKKEVSMLLRINIRPMNYLTYR